MLIAVDWQIYRDMRHPYRFKEVILNQSCALIKSDG